MSSLRPHYQQWGDSQSGNWAQCQGLPTVQHANNDCTNEQKQGWTLATANIPHGECSSYQGFDLSGLVFGPYGGKSARDLFKRTGGSSVSIAESLDGNDR